MRNQILIIALALTLTSGLSCKACRHEPQEPTTSISSKGVEVDFKEQEEVAKKDEGKKIWRIDIGPAAKEEVAVAAATKDADKTPPKDAALPPGTNEESDLSSRLREKMLDAYGGKEDSVPDVKIYISDMNYPEFVDYYKNLGYKVETVAVPATEVIEPVLAQRPELAGKIKLEDYENTVIHQVIVQDAGISAADKYIDPDTFEVVNKTFVTKMNK